MTDTGDFSDDQKDSEMEEQEVSALHRLRSLFDDRPDLLEIVTLADAESQEMLDALRNMEGWMQRPPACYQAEAVALERSPS